MAGCGKVYKSSLTLSGLTKAQAEQAKGAIGKGLATSMNVAESAVEITGFVRDWFGSDKIRESELATGLTWNLPGRVELWLFFGMRAVLVSERQYCCSDIRMCHDS